MANYSTKGMGLRMWAPLLFFWGIRYVIDVFFVRTILFIVYILPGMVGIAPGEMLRGERVMANAQTMMELVARYRFHSIALTSIGVLIYGVIAFRMDAKLNVKIATKGEQQPEQSTQMERIGQSEQSEQTEQIEQSEQPRQSEYLLSLKGKVFPYAFIWVIVLSLSAGIGLQGLLFLAQGALQGGVVGHTLRQIILGAVNAPLWLQIIGLGMLAPVAEEFLFRGLLFKRYKERNTFWMAALFSAVIFGFVHSASSHFIFSVIIGIACAYLYEKYDSIVAPIIFHVGVNLIFLIWLHSYGLVEMLLNPVSGAFLVIGSAFVAALVITRLQRIQWKIKV